MKQSLPLLLSLLLFQTAISAHEQTAINHILAAEMNKPVLDKKFIANLGSQTGDYDYSKIKKIKKKWNPLKLHFEANGTYLNAYFGKNLVLFMRVLQSGPLILEVNNQEIQLAKKDLYKSLNKALKVALNKSSLWHLILPFANAEVEGAMILGMTEEIFIYSAGLTAFIGKQDLVKLYEKKWKGLLSSQEKVICDNNNKKQTSGKMIIADKEFEYNYDNATKVVTFTSKSKKKYQLYFEGVPTNISDLLDKTNSDPELARRYAACGNDTEKNSVKECRQDQVKIQQLKIEDCTSICAMTNFGSFLNTRTERENQSQSLQEVQQLSDSSKETKRKLDENRAEEARFKTKMNLSHLDIKEISPRNWVLSYDGSPLTPGQVDSLKTEFSAAHIEDFKVGLIPLKEARARMQNELFEAEKGSTADSLKAQQKARADFANQKPVAEAVQKVKAIAQYCALTKEKRDNLKNKPDLKFEAPAAK